MKAVKFTIERMPEIRYAKNQAIKELRDVYAQILIRQCSKKLGSADVKEEVDLKNYLILIFEKALELRLSQKELERLESMRVKFSFLHYETKADESIHQFLRIFTALCNGDKKAVESLVIRWPILDDQGNILSLRRGLDWEYSKALRDDVANLTRDCIREFLEELRETGRIMTSAELEESHRTTDELSTDGSHEHSDDVKSQSADGEDTKGEAKPSEDRTAASQRGAGLDAITDRKENDQKDNQVQTEDNLENQNNELLDYLLSWIDQLPQWLQDQVLNSASMKALIESIEKTAAIYDKKPITELFVSMQSNEFNGYSLEDVENIMQENAKPSEMSSPESFDISIIYEGSTVSGWILPTLAIIGSGNILGDSGFDNLAINFNGLNGIDVF